MALAIVLLALLAAACTAPAADDAPSPTTPPPAEDPSPATEPEPPPIPLAVVARGDDAGRLDGIRMAIEEVNGDGGIDGRPLALQQRRSVGFALEEEGPAVLLLGPGELVEEHREELEDSGAPVFLFEGDLYSRRGLFRSVFQVSPPILWQARVLARYAADDRGHRRVGLLHDAGPDGEAARDAAIEAFERRGIDLDPVAASDELGAPIRAVLERTDALVVAGGRDLAAIAARAVAGLEDPPQLLLPASALDADLNPAPPPGTVAVGPYTWAPWAEPIPRVRRFRARFERAFGRLPTAWEQEGYDGVRALADVLADGPRGPRVVGALEELRPTGPMYSSLPITLGPDDHVLAEELQLGLFAVSPREVDPWVEGVPWRPLIRTFTYNGRRTLFLERDRQVFFPFWRPGRPSPVFARSRLGIVTRADDDPLH